MTLGSMLSPWRHAQHTEDHLVRSGYPLTTSGKDWAAAAMLKQCLSWDQDVLQRSPEKLPIRPQNLLLVAQLSCIFLFDFVCLPLPSAPE